MENKKRKKLVVIKFRTSSYEKKIIKIQAEKSGLSVSQFCRKSVNEQKIINRLTDEEIGFYKMLVKYSNNFTSIGNMLKNKDPNFSKEVYKLAKEFKFHLLNFKK